MIFFRSTLRPKNAWAIQHRSRSRCSSGLSRVVERGRSRARSFLRLRHDGACGAEAEPAWAGIDITHSASASSSAADRCVPRAHFDSRRRAEGCRRRSRARRADKHQFQLGALSHASRRSPTSGSRKGRPTAASTATLFKPDGQARRRRRSSPIKGGEARHSGAWCKRPARRRSRTSGAKNGHRRDAGKADATRMKTGGIAAGLYETEYGQTFEKVQILTVEELLSRARSRTCRGSSVGLQEGAARENDEAERAGSIGSRSDMRRQAPRTSSLL